MNEEEIQKRRRENEEKATATKARILGLPYLDTREFENTLELLPDLLTVPEMHSSFIVPLQRGDHFETPFQFMVTSQAPKSAIDNLRRTYHDNGDDIQFFLISGSAFRAFMTRYDPPKLVKYDDIRIGSEGDEELLASVSKTLNSVPADKVFDFLIDQADKLHASDIHIENLRTSIRIRMRVDGILHPVALLDRSRYRIIISELGSRADISAAATHAQSSHIQKEVKTPSNTTSTSNGSSHLLNIRVETIPTMYGQDAVLRLFNFDESLLNLDLLGLSMQELETINEVISHPRGMVLMAGPTGSGKSTTLYSIINALNTTERKIITLEDPIEYGITGISQIPVNTTNDQKQLENFADGLRSVLRLDPDVVMIGEIRDIDTARTAIQASITGHLVLSSFHANTAAAAFSRMVDMIGINPIFSSAIRLVIAQRLVRRLDANKTAYEPDAATKNYVKSILQGIPENALATLRQSVDIDNFKLYKPVASEENPFGYKGRMAIMEQMVVTPDIQAYLRGDAINAGAEIIEQTARDNGMLTLLQKGVIAALRGETTLQEVNRVI